MHNCRKVAHSFILLLFLTTFLTISPTQAADFQGPDTVVITEEMALRSSSFFGGSFPKSGILEKGTKGKILEIDTNKVYGVGVRIRITEGPKKGKVGWVYYATNPNKRKIDILDINGKSVDYNRKEFFPNFRRDAKTLKEKGYQVFDTNSDTPIVLKETPKTIWNKVSTGEYRIDNSRDQGGPRIPIIREYRDTAGNSREVTFYIDRDIERMLTLPSSIQEGLKIPLNCFERREALSGPEGKFDDWLPGCEELGMKLNENSYKKLSACMDSIKKTVLNGAGSGMNINRDVVYKNLYSKLNKKEQEFAAMTLTSFGEAGILAPPLEEMVMIMKVLNNRKEYAINKGFEHANELDAALQPYQFSMWNKKDPNWKRALRANDDNPHTKNSIKAYIQYQNSDYRSNTKVNKIYHYHTDYVAPDWSRGVRSNPVEINGKSLKQRGKRHLFYSNIAWSFKYNSTKKSLIGK
jgi:hypothetical protein